MRPASVIIAAYIVAILVLPAASNAHAEITGYAESKVTVNERENFCQDSTVQAEKLAVNDMTGRPIKQTAAGSQVLMQAIIENACHIDGYPVSIIFEVRNSDGMTSYLTIQQVRSSQDTETFTVGSSWTAKDPGEYAIRVFSIACPTCIGILIPSPSYDVSVY